MKKELLISSLLLTAVPVVANAEGQFATLKTKEACTNKTPEGKSHSAPYFSADCKTLYVLPSTKLPTLVVSPYFTGPLGVCKRYQIDDEIASSYKEDNKDLKEYIKVLNNKRTELAKESPQNTSAIESINAQLAKASQELKENNLEIKNIFEPYNRMLAVRAKIEVESDIMSEREAFAEVNKGLAVAPATITDSVLAIQKIDPSDTSLLKANFPGTILSDDAARKLNYNNQNVTLVSMNGGLSGVVDLSATTYCDAVLRKDVPDFSTDPKTLASIFNSAIALNLDYKVSVQVGTDVTLTSSVNSDFQEKLIQNTTQKSIYEISGLRERTIKGGIFNNLKITMDDGGVDLSYEDLFFKKGSSVIESFLKPLIGQFIENYFEQIENSNKEYKIFKEMPLAEVAVAAPGTTIERGPDQQVCETHKSGLFGWGRTTSCNNIPTYVTVNHDAIINMTQEQKEIITRENTAQFHANTTVFIRHNSLFGQVNK